MDIKKLVPVAFSLNKAKFSVDDLIWDDAGKCEFKISTECSQLDNFNDPNFTWNDDHLYVISFADRPNTTGLQIVDHLDIDAKFKSGFACDMQPDYFDWSLAAGNPLKSWKPNHAAMLKQWQAAQGNKEQAHHIALQVEELGNQPKPLDIVINPDVKSFDEISDNIGAAIESCKPVFNIRNVLFASIQDSLGYHRVNDDQQDYIDSFVSNIIERLPILIECETKDKPVFTQAMADVGEFPMVGSECLIMYVSSNYRGVITYMGDGVGCYYSKDNDREYTFALNSVTFKSIKTDEDKLRDVVIFAINEECGISKSEDVFASLLASDKFTMSYYKGDE